MEEIKAALYVVGTPIGNLGDMSQRAVEILKDVSFIAAEDTRVTVKLLNRFEIKKPMISYFEHNKAFKGDEIVSRILGGESCALVSDAGMPAISDPGETLVAQCAEAGIEVLAVSGPSAVTAALALSGLPTGRFTFEGFLSVNKKSRKEHLIDIKDEKRTMVFYEAPHKLRKTLRDLYEMLGERRVALVREITKIHEEAIRINLSEAAVMYASKEPKGEYVIVIEGAKEVEKCELTMDEAVKIAKELTEGGISPSEAAKKASKISGISKSDIYRQMMT